jgi:drug/metabolite transporter (DMT)-like permease
MKKRYLDFLMLQSTFLLFSFSAILFKKATEYEIRSNEFILCVSLGLVVMVVYAVLWQQMLKKFSLTVAFSNKVVMYFWMLIWAVLFFREAVTIWNIIGLCVISIGVIVVSLDG